MQRPASNENQFVVDLLTTLQEERFSPLAWWSFLVRSWNMSRETANNNPSLKRSWARTTALMSILTLGICVLVGFFEGPTALLRMLPGLLFCVVWQQSDLFWHLGLNCQAQSNQLRASVGIANVLTELRGLGAAFLLGRLVGGLFTPVWLALLVFSFGVLTDILDGLVARTTQTQSKLGQIADGEADFCLYLALSIILVQDAILPLWLGVVLVLRFFIPLIAALISYLLFAHPVRFGSTRWGKGAGLSQCLYFFVLLAPPPLTVVVHFLNLPLLIATLFLIIAAPVAQFMANVQTHENI
jgi:phosphatidylglycerophosphate synthase